MRALSQASFATVRRLMSRETFRYLSRRILLGYAVLQSLAGLETGHPGSGNLDGLLGVGVAADASLPILGLENAEAGNLHLLTLDKRGGDAVNLGIQSTLGILFAHAGTLGAGGDQFGFIHNNRNPLFYGKIFTSLT